MGASRRGAGTSGDANDPARTEPKVPSCLQGRFPQVADCVADAIVIANEDCLIQYANDAAERIFGVLEKELIGKPCDDPTLGLASADGSPLEPDDFACHRALESGATAGPVELTVQRPHGGPAIILASASPLRDEDGTVVGVVNSYTDITERKRAEEVLRESDERNSSLLRTYAALGQANSHRAILDAIRPEIRDTLGYESVWLQLVRNERAELLTLHVGGTVEQSLRTLMEQNPSMVALVGDDEFLALPVTDDPYLSRVIESRRIDVLEDARTAPITNMPTNKDLVAASGNRTIVAVPLMLADEKLGMLSMGTFFDEGVLTPTQAQVDWLAALANHVAVALDRVRFLVKRQENETALRERDEHNQSLLRLYEGLGRANTYTAILQALLAEIPSVLGYQSAGLLVVDEDCTRARLLQAKGTIEKAAEGIMGLGDRFQAEDEGEWFLVLPIGDDPFLKEIVEATHIVVVEDARTDPRTDKEIVAASDNRTIINVPLMLAGEKLGVLNTGTFGDDEGVRPPTPAQLDYLKAAANHIAVAMDRVRFLRQQKEAENALRESEERYRRFVETSIEGVWAVDEQLKTAFVSNQMAKMLRFSAKELVGRAASDLMFDEDKAEFEERMHRRRNGRGETYEMRFRRADGTVIWLQLSATPIFDESGRFEGSFAMATDVTQRKHAEEELERLVGKLQDLLAGVVDALSSTTSQRDPYTAMHQERVARLSCAIAKEMLLPAEFTDGLNTAALLHDIGKIAVPSEILTKPGKLTDLEMGIVRSHAGVGYKLLEHVAFGRPVAQAVLQHHERLDGSGYPRGLVGDEILLESRILAVADVVEAMSSYRPYRPALGMDAALEEIEAYAYTKYDADVVGACTHVLHSGAVVL